MPRRVGTPFPVYRYAYKLIKSRFIKSENVQQAMKNGKSHGTTNVDETTMGLPEMLAK